MVVPLHCEAPQCKTCDEEDFSQVELEGETDPLVIAQKELKQRKVA